MRCEEQKNVKEIACRLNYRLYLGVSLELQIFAVAMHEFRSAEEQRRTQSNGDRDTRGEENPGPKNYQPPCDLLPGTQEYLFFYCRGLPCERTHHGKGLSLVTSFFHFFLCHQRTPTRRLLHASPYLASSRRHGSHLLDLLIIIEIHPIIISSERSRAVEQRKRSRRPATPWQNSAAPSSPPRSNPIPPRPARSESRKNETLQMSTCDGEMAPNSNRKPQEYKNQGGKLLTGAD